ncbi:MAG TPA: hypothetical protein VMV03_06185 [Spirochaetia bacterium]|nr:hypothetical protein [Spirochaetia bacterium]
MDSKLLEACVVLLGPQARRAGKALLAQLTVAMVRSAFRRLALQTHPDMTGTSRTGTRFIEASRAYELLMAFLLARGRHAEETRAEPRRPAAPQARPSSGPAATQQEAGTANGRAANERPSEGQAQGARAAGPQPHRTREIFYGGPLPRRRLRLAEFLYYSGRISWQTLISALVWQRSSRPRFLELARQLRAVEGMDVIRVLRARAGHERTGETAYRLRLLSVEDVARILRIQRARQRPIGRYFIEHTIMTNEDITEFLRELFRHNALCGLPASRQRERATA